MDVLGAAGCGGVGLGEFLFGTGEADLESFGFAGPAFAFGFGDAGQEVGADLLQAGPLGGVDPEERAADAGVLVDAGGAVCSSAVAEGDAAALEVYLDKFLPASNLKPGTHLKTPNGQLAVVVGGSTPAVHDGWMWDLTVPGNNDHDFYVAAGTTEVLVHNCSAAVQKARTALQGWTSKSFQIGENGQAFSLDRNAMVHILTRHAPEFWDGSVKATQMLVDLSKGSQVVETRFPDQPVIFQIKRVSGGMLRISCSYGEVSREASAREERVLAAMRQAGLDFYSRMLDLVPSNFERYAHPMEMLSSE